MYSFAPKRPALRTNPFRPSKRKRTTSQASERFEMGGYGAVIFIGVIVALAVVVRGAFAKRRSIAVALISLPLALLAAGCAWYAFAESQSLPWTIGHGVVALLSVGVGIKHLAGDQTTHG